MHCVAGTYTALRVLSLLALDLLLWYHQMIGRALYLAKRYNVVFSNVYSVYCCTSTVVSICCLCAGGSLLLWDICDRGVR